MAEGSFPQRSEQSKDVNESLCLQSHLWLRVGFLPNKSRTRAKNLVSSFCTLFFPKVVNL